MIGRLCFTGLLAGLLLVAAYPRDPQARDASALADDPSLPPPAVVEDLAGLVGKWQGRFNTRMGASGDFTWMIRGGGFVEVQLEIYDIQVGADLEPAFAAMKQKSVGGVIVTTDAVLLQSDLTIVRLAATHRLPLIADSRNFVDQGALISYGPNYPALMRYSVGHVDKVIKGTKPAHLPIEMPTRFEMRVNLKTAKALGITFPPAILARADEVIE